MTHPTASFAAIQRTQYFTAAAQPPQPPRNGMVWGAATRALPGTSEDALAAFNNHERDVGTIGCYRTYGGGGMWPTSWSGLTDGARYGNWQARWSWVSFKPNLTNMASGGLDASLRSFVNSIPVTGYKRMLTMWHEPENDTMDQATYKRASHRFYSVAKDAGHPDVLVGPCFMARFNTAWLNTMMASATVDLASVIDFVGWDPYNEAAMDLRWPADRQGSQGTAYYYGPLRTWVDNNLGGPSMPLAFGEIGYTNDTLGSALRPNWLYDTESWCNANNVIAVCYYDSYATRAPQIRVHTHERPPWPSAPYPADPRSMAALGDLYTQYPAYAT